MSQARYTTAILQNDAVAVSAMAGMEEFPAVIVLVTGITTATITWEISDDGTTWFGVMATPLATGTKAATATANGFYVVPTLGAKQFRARISAWTAGTIDVVARPSDSTTIFP